MENRLAIESGTSTLHPTVDKLQPLLLVIVTPEPDSKAWDGVLSREKFNQLNNWNKIFSRPLSLHPSATQASTLLSDFLYVVNVHAKIPQYREFNSLLGEESP